MRTWKHYYKRFLIWKTTHLNKTQVLVGASLIIGLLCGLASVILKNLVSYTYRLITSFSFSTLDNGNFLYLMYPMIGIAITVILVRYVIKADLSHGVSKVLYALSRNDGKIATHNCWSSLITSTITVGFGGSVGLEAPIVYTGSAIGSNISRFLHLNPHLTKILVASGAAGAVAGIFKAPIAGILFTFEVLMLDLSMVAMLPMLVSAITAAMVSYFYLGSASTFTFVSTVPFTLNKIPAFIVLGVVSAIICLYYFKIDSLVTKIFKRLPIVLKVIIGGLLLGGLIYVFPPLFGEGYPALNNLLSGNIHAVFQNSFFYNLSNNTLVLILVFLGIILLKSFATSITCSAGGVGGVFAPSLFIGGFVGFFVARLLNLTGLMPVSESNFVLVGMSSVMAGIMFAPLTSIFLIAEVTGGYNLLAPLLISTTIAYLTVKASKKYSVYATPLAKQGDLMTHNKDYSALHFMDKHRIMETNFYKLNINDSLRQIVKGVEHSNRNFFIVEDDEGYFKGVVVVDDVRQYLFHEECYDKILVKDIVRYSDYFIADINDPMERIAKKFQGTDRYTIVVTDKGKFVGCLSRANVFQAYQQYIRENLSDD